jgi:hypothetical protein
MPEVGGSATRASRLDTLQVSSIAILAPGYQARESLGTKGYAIRFPLRPSTTVPLLLRFEEAVKSVEARFGSRFPPEAVTIKSDPKTTQLLGRPPRNVESE